MGDENRPMNVTFRLSEREWVAMQQAAALVGMRPSAWLRAAMHDRLAKDRKVADARAASEAADLKRQRFLDRQQRS